MNILQLSKKIQTNLIQITESAQNGDLLPFTFYNSEHRPISGAGASDDKVSLFISAGTTRIMENID